MLSERLQDLLLEICVTFITAAFVVTLSVMFGFVQGDIGVGLLQFLAAVFTASSILVALQNHLYKKEEDRKASAIEQVSFLEIG
jgi:NADH:ubiquinone oxidoreductase subunit 4 (subunit M)